jgi:NADPH-dependent 2,4-dienoyl-CoA reductase/sulfur reductase-like enzyme
MAEPDADVVIVGAGPAGLSAAVALRRAGVARVLVLDREPDAGGVPRFCGHSPYGLREFRRPMLGPAYARALVAAARQAGAEIRTGTTVVGLLEGPAVSVTSDAGPERIVARAVLLATGTRETTRAGRLIGGTKPGGVLTTGALQGLVYGAGMRPFRRPVILGTELVAFSAILTCRHAGIRPVAVVDTAARVTARFPAALLPRALGIPVLLATRLVAVEGRDRVEGVLIDGPAGERFVGTDGLIVTGGFRPDATLVRDGHLTLDPATGGPEIDEYGRTSDPAVFAAGNLLRSVETAGWCWEEGRRVGQAMAAALRGQLPAQATARIDLFGPLRYAVPQRRSGGADPAFDTLQLRADGAFRGRLSLRSDGHEVAGRNGAFLPERRLLLPLPPRGGTPSVGLEGHA